jgi:type II secretory pathway pseudopilin PulG
MRPACLNRTRAISLIELIVATFILGLISVAAFKILVEGSQYLRVNQMAIDAQRSGLALLSDIGSGMQATRPDLVTTGAEGLVFASPFKPDGTVEFDPVNRELRWQKWVCYYLDQTVVTRRELPIALPSANPGSAPSPASFSGIDVSKTMGDEVTAFQVSQLSASPPLWAIDLTVGSMTNKSRYGIELHSEVGPRN